MLVKTVQRVVGQGGLNIFHDDLLVISESESDSKILDALGQPGTTFTGEVRLSDGYGEHYLLIQPLVQYGAGYTRSFAENERRLKNVDA